MPESFKDELLNGIRTAFCGALELNDEYLDWVDRSFPGTAFGRGVNDWLYRQYCNREPPPPASPPFTGGQCIGLSYYVQVIGNVTLPDSTVVPINEFNAATQLYGPITDAGIRPTTSGGYEVYASGQNAVGAPTTLILGGGCCWSEPLVIEVTAINVTPRFGGPDDCGDPPVPPPNPTPGYNQIDVDITYTDSDGNDVTLVVPFIFATARVNLKGEITVPIRLTIGELNLQIGGDINLSTGGISLNFGNKNYQRNGQPNPDGYETPDDIPDNPPTVPEPIIPPSPDDDEPDTTAIIRGCIVTVTSYDSPVPTVIFQDDNPDIYAPNLGYVQFLVAIGTVPCWTADIAVKNFRHIIECPWSGGAIAVRGTPRAGVTWNISEVYATIENEVSFTLFS